MEQIPTLVQELNLRNQTNAVIIDTGRFTIEQFNLFFTQSNPAPAKLARQLTSCSSAYDRMNASYAVQVKSLDTAEIKGLDQEGDQLVYGITGTVDAFKRMTFDAEKQRKAQVFDLFFRKYGIDPRENMIAQWSKIQQACEECSQSAELQDAATALGLDGAMARLSQIATLLRQKITERSAEAPEAKAMQNAREAFYPEYRTLILLLNSFAVVDDDTTRFSQLIGILNRNIDYIRIHAMTSSSAAGTSGQGGGGGTTTPTTPETPETPENPENPETPDTPDTPVTPDPGTGSGGNDIPGGFDQG